MQVAKWIRRTGHLHVLAARPPVVYVCEFWHSGHFQSRKTILEISLRLSHQCQNHLALAPTLVSIRAAVCLVYVCETWHTPPRGRHKIVWDKWLRRSRLLTWHTQNGPIGLTFSDTTHGYQSFYGDGLFPTRCSHPLIADVCKYICYNDLCMRLPRLSRSLTATDL